MKSKITGKIKDEENNFHQRKTFGYFARYLIFINVKLMVVGRERERERPLILECEFGRKLIFKRQSGSCKFYGDHLTRPTSRLSFASLVVQMQICFLPRLSVYLCLSCTCLSALLTVKTLSLK